MRSFKSEAGSRDRDMILGDFAFRGSTSKLVTQRYFFNLTDGEDTICDQVGVEASDIQSARVHAFEIIEDMRREDPSFGEDADGWRLEIVNSSGFTVDIIILDSAGQNCPIRH